LSSNESDTKVIGLLIVVVLAYEAFHTQERTMPDKTVGLSAASLAILQRNVHIRRIYSEYLEMPGLRLTVEQAQRLWGLDSDTCASSLKFLIEAGFLQQTSSSLYVRASDGPVALPIRMAKAELSRDANARLGGPAAARR
jgi:hypothetical protein